MHMGDLYSRVLDIGTRQKKLAFITTECAVSSRCAFIEKLHIFYGPQNSTVGSRTN